MVIDNDFLDELTTTAKSSPRLRANIDMRNSSKDNSQRNLNALEPGTIVPIHRHLQSSETCVLIRGALKSTFYNDIGELIKCTLLDQTHGNYAVSIPAGQWHSVEVLESGTVIFEAKDGGYEPLSQEDILNV